MNKQISVSTNGDITYSSPTFFHNIPCSFLHYVAISLFLLFKILRLSFIHNIFHRLLLFHNFIYRERIYHSFNLFFSLICFIYFSDLLLFNSLLSFVSHSITIFHRLLLFHNFIYRGRIFHSFNLYIIICFIYFFIYCALFSFVSGLFTILFINLIH